MRNSDRKLGMDRSITRRDVIHGIGAIGAGFVIPGSLLGCAKRPASESSYYPPALTGLRGNHDGGFEVAHALAREGRTDWGPVQKPDSLVYDLVIVGAGLSGLSAAHFYRKERPDARILILDNHDDFGGHAKRNEFEVEGKHLIGHGGSQTMAAPSSYSDVVKGLLNDLGIDIERFYTAYDLDFEKRHGLKRGFHFTKEAWGVDRTIPRGLRVRGSNPEESALSLDEAVAQMPISEAARRELLQLLAVEKDQLPDIPVEEKPAYLASISYREFLTRHLGVTEPEVFALFQDIVADIGLGIEATDAYLALTYASMPGWAASGLPDPGDTEPYIHHFPDGNASIARLLVRSMIPDVAPGNSMEDIVTARFDYSKLDQDNSPVRVRLNSTVVDVEHDGGIASAETVNVSYVRDGQAYRVQARSCVLACYNAMIPYLCRALPDAQKETLANQVKQPMLLTNVALRNWHPWKKLGIGSASAPGAYFTSSMLDFPVSLGDYKFSSSPDEPILAVMFRNPHVDNQGLTAKEQWRLARYELLSTSFEDIERHVRVQLNSLLGEAGFDSATDIMGITVNRWSHGYAYEHHFHALFDDDYDDPDDPRYLHVQARKPFGRIAIANSDAGASAMVEGAVEQAHRAVTELLNT